MPAKEIHQPSARHSSRRSGIEKQCKHDVEAAGTGAQRVDRRVLGRAGVDDERLARRAGEVDLGVEGALLVGARRAVAVEVQAGLADGHAAVVAGELGDLVERRVVEARGEVGVAADGGEHLRERLGGGERAAARRRRPSRR